MPAEREAKRKHECVGTINKLSASGGCNSDGLKVAKYLGR